jgi:hypothetical protein
VVLSFFVGNSGGEGPAERTYQSTAVLSYGKVVSDLSK